MKVVLKSILLVCLVAAAWFQFGQSRSAAELWQGSIDLLDSRPTHSVLILGNSRTYANDMPQMIRKIADSAGDVEKYQIRTAAFEGASFESLSQASEAKELMSQEWDDAILQGESRGQSSPESLDAFQKYGIVLAGSIKTRRHRPMLIVNWAYDPNLYPSGEGRPGHLAKIRSGHDTLAYTAALEEISVSQAWERARSEFPSIKLTIDGNHPSVAGSYLVALAIYAKLSGKPVSSVRYAPLELTTSEAEALRRVVGEIG